MLRDLVCLNILWILSVGELTKHQSLNGFHKKTIRADFEINRNFLTPPLLKKKNKQTNKQTNKQKKNKSRLTKNRKTHRRNEMERKIK